MQQLIKYSKFCLKVSNERALIVAGTTLLSIQDNFLAFLVGSQLFQSFNFGKYIHYFSFFINQ